MTSDTKEKGIVILGAPRSGTTLLRRLLDGHSAIACPGETNLLTACGRFLKSETLAQGLTIGVLQGLDFAGFSQDEVIARLRDFAFGFFRDHAAQTGKKRWAEKTALDVFYLDELEILCRDHVQYVCVQRHGLDVALSIEDLCRANGGYLSELHDYVRRFPCLLEAFSHAWVDLATALHEFTERHGGNTFTIKYEDLVTDPESNLREVFSFLGEEWEDGLIERALENKENLGLGDWKTYAKSKVDRGSIDRWRKLSQADLQVLGPIVNPALERCGYPALEWESDVSPAEARRRYEMGLLVQGVKDESPDSSRKEEPGDP